MWDALAVVAPRSPLPDDASELDYEDIEETASDAEAKELARRGFHSTKEALKQRMQRALAEVWGGGDVFGRRRRRGGGQFFWASPLWVNIIWLQSHF